MAKKRAIGAALAKSGDMFTQLAQSLAQLRQREEADRRAREDEFRLNKMLETHRTDENIRQERSRYDTMRGPVGASIIDQINKAQSVNDLPTPSGVMTSLRADERFTPTSEYLQSTKFPMFDFPGLGLQEDVALPIRGENDPFPIEEQIMRSLLARRSRLGSLPQAAAASGQRIGPEGVQVTGMPGSEVRTEKLPSERIAQENQVEAGTRPEKVITQGALARADTPPSLQPGYGPDDKPGLFRVNPWGGEASLVPGMTPDNVAPRGPGGDGGADFLIVAQNIPLLKELSQQINVSEGFMGQYLPGIARWAKGKLGVDNIAQLYDRLLQPTGVALASIVNGGRPTEPDRQAAQMLLPATTTNARVAQVLIANMENLLAQYQMGGMEAVFMPGQLASYLTAGLSDDELQQALGDNFEAFLQLRGPGMPGADLDVMDAADALRQLRQGAMLMPSHRRGGGL